jgi:hypothetical protein
MLQTVFSDLAAAPALANSSESIGTIKSRDNDIRRRNAGTLTWRQAHAGMPLYEADAIYTSEDSSAELEMFDGTIINLDERSLVVVTLRKDTESGSPNAVALDLVRGSARSVSGQLPTTVRIGDSELRASANTDVRLNKVDGQTRVTVVKGHAILSNKGQTQDLGSGTSGLVDESGSVVGKLDELFFTLTSPAFAQLFYVTSESPSLEIPFRWDATEGNGPYFLEVSANADFTAVAVREQLGGTSAQLTLGAGTHFWRVRREIAGTVASSEKRKLLILEDVPPTALQPLADEDVFQKRSGLSLAWTPVPDVTLYRVELASGRRFERPIVSTETKLTFIDHNEPLPEGQYCYRVRSVAIERGESPWSKETCFNVVTQPRLPAPKLYDPTIEIVPRQEPTP